MSSPVASQKLPEVTIDFEDVSVTLKLTAAQQTRGIATVSGALLDAALAVPRAIALMARAVCAPSAPAGAASPPANELAVLKGCSGRIAPGRLTLVVAPPGAGKTTLLRALAGVLPAGRLSAGSKVLYGGADAAALRASGTTLGQLVQYVDQRDDHMPFLTVRETLAFVAVRTEEEERGRRVEF